MFQVPVNAKNKRLRVPSPQISSVVHVHVKLYLGLNQYIDISKCTGVRLSLPIHTLSCTAYRFNHYHCSDIVHEPLHSNNKFLPHQISRGT